MKACVVGDPSFLDLGPSCMEQDGADLTAQFAPLLQLRRKQMSEATAASARVYCDASSIEDSLKEAFETMTALDEASRSVSALFDEVLCGEFSNETYRNSNDQRGFCDIGEFNLRIEEADVMVLSPRLLDTVAEIHAAQADVDSAGSESIGMGLQDAPARDLTFPVDEEDTASVGTSRPSFASPFRDQDLFRSNWRDAIEHATTATMRGSQVVGSVAEAGWSVAEGFLSMATSAYERATIPIMEARGKAPHAANCVEGLLRVDGDLAMDALRLTETLRVVLHILLQPLAQVRSITLTTIPSECLHSSLSTPDAGLTSCCSFAYKICVADPHDLEPLRETLLLEAESGGARSFLPLLTEQLCEESHAMPRHLKVRLEVQTGVY